MARTCASAMAARLIEVSPVSSITFTPRGPSVFPGGGLEQFRTGLRWSKTF
jgi:hypothetical protein